MLLTVDLGNTSVKLSLFDEGELIAFIFADSAQDNYRAFILKFLHDNSFTEKDVDVAIFSCVVPKRHPLVYEALQSLIGDHIIDINSRDYYGIKIDVPNPDEVGDDIIVMCAYAYHLYKREVLVVSVGTCTVVCHVDNDGNFKHCIIAPGFLMMANALWSNAAQLPELYVDKIPSFLANNTIDAMKVGLYDGYIGMVEHLVGGLKKELHSDPYVIACGGLGKKITPYTDIFDIYDPDFVSKGLNFIYQRYKK